MLACGFTSAEAVPGSPNKIMVRAIITLAIAAIVRATHLGAVSSAVLLIIKRLSGKRVNQPPAISLDAKRV